MYPNEIFLRTERMSIYFMRHCVAQSNDFNFVNKAYDTSWESRYKKVVLPEKGFLY